MRMARLQHI